MYPDSQMNPKDDLTISILLLINSPRVWHSLCPRPCPCPCPSSIYLHLAVPLSPPVLQSLYLEYMDSCVMALRCGLHLGAFSLLLLPAAPAFSRSPSFQKSAACPRYPQCSIDPAHSDKGSPLHPCPPHLGPLSTKPICTGSGATEGCKPCQLAL